jgi:hypothetical protein
MQLCRDVYLFDNVIVVLKTRCAIDAVKCKGPLICLVCADGEFSPVSRRSNSRFQTWLSGRPGTLGPVMQPCLAHGPFACMCITLFELLLTIWLPDNHQCAQQLYMLCTWPGFRLWLVSGGLGSCFVRMAAGRCCSWLEIWRAGQSQSEADSAGLRRTATV